MSDLVDAAVPLASVLLGTWLGRTGTRDDWRRDQRTASYAATLLEARKLQHRLERAETMWMHDPEGRGPLGHEEMLELSQAFEEASAPAQIFAGALVSEAIDGTLRGLFSLIDETPGQLDLARFAEAVDALSEAMRRELEPPRRRLLYRIYRW